MVQVGGLTLEYIVDIKKFYVKKKKKFRIVARMDIIYSNFSDFYVFELVFDHVSSNICALICAGLWKCVIAGVCHVVLIPVNQVDDPTL